MTSPRSNTSSCGAGTISRQRPTNQRRFPKTRTAPSSIGGRTTGSTTRARRIMDRGSLGVMRQWRREVMGLGRSCVAPTFHRSISDTRFLSPALDARRHGMLAGFVFAVTFANLLLDFLSHQIDSGIKIALTVLCEKVGAGHRQANGTGKLLLRRFPVVMFQ